jgi:molybdopterin-guanine dinucleotide biosynthesis protein A/N-acetylglutamate synthase-like GNAT family acetyltransferase
LTGVLLVGGASRRFGSPKALAPFDGETLAARGWRLLGVACEERLAVGKARDGLDLPFAVQDDGVVARHPAAGIAAGLRASGTDVSVFLPVDTPLVPPRLLRALGEACVDAAVPAGDTTLPAAFHRRALPALERAVATQGSLRAVLAELDVRTVPAGPGLLANVNRPSDLEALALPIVRLRSEHAEGFRALVADTLAEFGFRADPELDADLEDPGRYYAAVWVALRDGQVSGSIALRRLDQTELELKRMYLRPELRGRGIGKRLLATALDWARAHGARRVGLDTTEEMAAARHLYEATGFRRVPGDLPRQGKPRLLYELELP